MYGVSQGGYWVQRTLAFQHRFPVAAAGGGMVDVGGHWQAHLPPEVVDLLDTGKRDEFNAFLDQTPPAQLRLLTWRGKPYGKPTMYDTCIEAIPQAATVP